MACVCVISKQFDCHKCADCFEQKCPYGYKPTKKQKELRHKQVLAARALHAKQEECKHPFESLKLVEVKQSWSPYQKVGWQHNSQVEFKCTVCGAALGIAYDNYNKKTVRWGE
jgi:hypothetical protein